MSLQSVSDEFSYVELLYCDVCDYIIEVSSIYCKGQCIYSYEFADLHIMY